jgi:hypothetical protein
MLLINKALSYLVMIEPDQQLFKLLILVGMGVLLGIFGYRFTVKPIRDRMRLSHKM